MKKMKRAAAAAVAAAVTAGTMAGCSSTDYALTADGKKVNAGVYISYALSEMTNQMYTMYYGGEVKDLSECFDKQIDGKDFTTYVKDSALEKTKEFATVNAKFDELGLKLSKDDKNTISDNVSSSWDSNGDFYESEGISRESIKQTYEFSYKRSAIFDYYYAEGGKEEVSADDLQKYVNDNYIRYKLVTIPKSTSTDDDTKESENAEIKELVDGYLEEAKDLDFEGFDKIIDEYDAYKEAKDAEDSSTDSTDSSADESAVTDLDSSSAADESSAADDTSSDDSSTADSSEADTELSADTDTSSSDDSSADGDSEEEDKYANETVVNYTDGTNKDSDSYSESNAELLKQIKEGEYGAATSWDNDTNYYIFMSADIAERTDYVDDNKETLLQSMKGDEFDSKVEGWVKEMKITVNNKAVKRYTVKEIYDRQTEYYNKKNG